MTTHDECEQIREPVEDAPDEDIDSSVLLRAHAGSDDQEDPLVEMARLDPVTAASFVKSAMLLGGVSSGLVATLSGALLFMNWSDWAACERPLRWWLLINCQMQLTQVPLRLTFWAGVKAAEAARESIPVRIAQMASTPAWRISKVISLLTYFWMILGVVWAMNAGRCTSCPQLISTVAAVLATSGARVLCAFAGFRVYFPQGRHESEAPQMVAATVEQINALATVTYESDESGESMSCAVCLSEFCDGEELRKLPCNHQFHVECADQWLGRSKRCPLCMQNVDEMGCASKSCRKRCEPCVQ